MAVNTTLAGLSQTAASNGPDGASDPPSALDDAIRYALAFIAELRDTYNPLGPAFSATPSAATSLTSGTPVKVTFGTEATDTDGCYDPTTSRFTPTVAGLYWIAGSVRLSSTATASLYVYKNGSQHKEIGVTAQVANQQTSGGTLVSMNGTTDYVELYCSQSAATQNSSSSGVSTWFQGHFVRPL